MQRIAIRLPLAAAALIASANPAAAHAFAQRYDLPLPLWLYIVGAGATVLVSFLFVAWFVSPGGGPAGGRAVRLTAFAPARLVFNRATAFAVQALSAAALVLLIVAGFAGAEGDPFVNILPTFVWVVWWVGLAYVSAFVGDVWSLTNPWAAIAGGAGALWQRAGFVRLVARRDPPEWLGAWPAVILFLGFGWAELVWPQNAVPAKLAGLILAYSTVTFAGMLVFGVERWLRTGEVFALFFGLFARFAPIDFRDGRLRMFGAGLLEVSGVSASLLVFVVLALAMVTFDGLAETPLWAGWTSAALARLHEAGLLEPLGYQGAGMLIKTAGLLAVPVAFFAVYMLVCAVTAAIAVPAGATVPAGGPATAPLPDGPRHTAFGLARRFVLTLVPIAIAYHLAHYLSYIMIYGQEIIRLVSDPMGRGWDLFGTAAYETDIAIVGARFVWGTSVAAIVIGHIAAIWLAHILAVRLFGDRRAALKSQLPMLVLMVAYTMLSLWILAQPIVEV